jgi:CRP/FNR family transcriptional regulator
MMGIFCLPLGLSKDELQKIDGIVDERCRLSKGEYLYKQGDHHLSLFSIRYGTLKSELILEDGRSQVIGFHLPGDIIGLDGICNKQHQSAAIALEDSEVCMMRFSELENLSQFIPSLQKHLHQILSREIHQDHRHLLTLGSLNADEKLASFFIDLSDRLSSRGLSPNEFDITMSREEIASYLGIQIETVSRVLSRFTKAGLIEVRNKHLKLINTAALSKMAG